MTRMPYTDLQQMSVQTRAMFERSPINLQRMLAGASEGVFAAFNGFAASFYGPSQLPDTLREVAILRVAYLSKCTYELLHRVPLGLHVGLTIEQIKAIEIDNDRDSILTPAQQAVLSFTDDIVLHVRASDMTLMAVREQLNDRQILDLILVIGLYRSVASVLETTGVEPDSNALDWRTMLAQQPT